jgi:urease accessory protein
VESVTSPSPEALVALLQLTDANAPVGGYAQSHGLEGLVQLGGLSDGRALRDVLDSLLKHSLATADLVGVVHAHRAAAAEDIDCLLELGTLFTAQKVAREAREASLGLGKRLLSNATNLTNARLLQAYRALVSLDRCEAHHCLVFGIVTQALDIAEEPATLGFGYTVLAGAVSAAIRLGLLGQNEAQLILKNEWGPLVEAVARARSLDVAQISSFAPMLEIAMMRHERAYSRLFSS